MGGWVRWQGSRPEEREGRIALEGLGDRHALRGAELGEDEAAHTATEGGKGNCKERACWSRVRRGRGDVGMLLRKEEGGDMHKGMAGC